MKNHFSNDFYREKTEALAAPISSYWSSLGHRKVCIGGGEEVVSGKDMRKGNVRDKYERKAFCFFLFNRLCPQ